MDPINKKSNISDLKTGITQNSTKSSDNNTFINSAFTAGDDTTNAANTVNNNSVFANPIPPEMKKEIEEKIQHETEELAEKIIAPEAQRAVEKARNEIGNLEIGRTNRSNSISKYKRGESVKDLINLDKALAQKGETGLEWCAAFFSYVNGYNAPYLNRNKRRGFNAYTPSIINQAKAAGCYKEKKELGLGDGKYKPLPGDALLWKHPTGGGHIGIIESCSPDPETGELIITTIEGNNTKSGTKESNNNPKIAQGVFRHKYKLSEIMAKGCDINGVVQMSKWYNKIRTEQ